MRMLTAVIVLLAGICSTPCAAADETPQRQVVFVCLHGNVKSLMAASYFNQLAEQQRLPFRAISRGSAPDSNTVPKSIAEALHADGVDVSEFRPAKVAPAEVAAAEQVITIGTELPADAHDDQQRIERWNDVPSASGDYAAARISLKEHVADLIERLRQAGE